MKKGYTLLELLIAIGIFSIFLFIIFSSIGGLYFSQKRLNITQKFSGEVRILMERISKSIRENNIDYDRYFIEIGPDVNICEVFSLNQIQNVSNAQNIRTNREILGYETIFFWDTNGDGKQDRNIGGVDLGAVNDDCIESVDGTNLDIDWDQDINTSENKSLLLINGDRTKRFAYRWVLYPENEIDFGRIEFQTQLGVDSDNDGVTDTWSSVPTWNSTSNECEINNTIITGENTERNCESAHDWISISMKRIDIQAFEIVFTPTADPYLAFRRDDMQVHPRTTIGLGAELKDADEQGFETGEAPYLFLQTTVSSRVFGNTRK